MAKFIAFVAKVAAFVKTPQGKRDVALAVAVIEALIQLAHQAGPVVTSSVASWCPPVC